MRSSIEVARSELAERLRERLGEIEEAALTRVKAIADPTDAADPSYVEGLRGAVAAAVEHGIAAVGRGGQSEPQIPLALLAQARSAARNGVSLDTVLRRYFAGYSLLGYFTVEEAGRGDLLEGPQLQRLLASQAVTFDRLLAAIAEEHARESETLRHSSEQRRTERIERLLAGEMVDASALAYEFEGWHLGLVASGYEAEEAIRELVAGLDCRLLLLRREEEGVWAWLGARRLLDPTELLGIARSGTAADRAIAIGEPGDGLAGWRLTHRQAAAALPVAQRGGEKAVRYGDVVLLASVLQDDLLASSLRRLYLRPLLGERDGGAALRETLRAYLIADGSVSSAASKLAVSRRTVANRLRRAEECIGRPVHSALAEIAASLQLAKLESTSETSRVEPSLSH